MTASQQSGSAAELMKNTPFRALFDYVYATQLTRKERIGTLYVPDDKREDAQEGIVFATGNGTDPQTGKTYTMVVQQGDHILWAKHWEKPVDLDRHTHFAAIREKDIIGIVQTRYDIENNQDIQDIVPLYNTVVIKADPLKEKVGLIHLPMQVKKPLMPAMEGTVVKVGPGHRLKDGMIQPLEVHVGDRVYFEAYGGEDHQFGGLSVRLVPEEHVLCIING